MATTTSYGTWVNHTIGSAMTLESEVHEALMDADCTDEQIEAVADAYRDAINAALPDSVSLCGNQFYGNAYPQDCTDQADYPHDENGRLDIAAIIESVDFWAIAEPLL